MKNDDRAEMGKLLTEAALKMGLYNERFDFVLREGPVRIEIPARMSDQSLELLADLFALILRSARAIEARRAETPLGGSVHESAIGEADAPKPEGS